MALTFFQEKYYFKEYYGDNRGGEEVCKVAFYPENPNGYQRSAIKNYLLDGVIIRKYGNGEIYVGECKGGDRNGYGILFDKNEKIQFEGEWKNDETKKGIYLDQNKNLVDLDNLVITTSHLFLFKRGPEQNTIKKEIQKPNEQTKFFNYFLDKLKQFSSNAGLQAIDIIETNNSFFKYLKSKIESVSDNLSTEIEAVKNKLNITYPNIVAFDKVYLKYLEAMDFYQNPEKYPNNWHVEYLKHIKEFGNLNLDLDSPKLKNKILIKQHDLTSFHEQEDQLKKLMYIPGYNEVLKYVDNQEYKADVNFVYVKKSNESSANDFGIFLINNISRNELQNIIEGKKPQIHGIAYYLFSQEKTGLSKLSYCGKLFPDDYQINASKAVELGFDSNNIANLFVFTSDNIKNIKNDQELFDLICKYKNHAILFKNQNNQNIPLDISTLNKVTYQNPSNAPLLKDIKQVTNPTQLSK